MFSAFTIKSNFFPGYFRYYCTDTQLMVFFRKHLESQLPPSIRYCFHLAGQLLLSGLIRRCCATCFFFFFQITTRWSISWERIKQQGFNFHCPEKTAVDASPSITHSSAPDLGNSIIFLPSASFSIAWKHYDSLHGWGATPVFSFYLFWPAPFCPNSRGHPLRYTV